MNAFQWLNDLMLWLGKIFPRLSLVKSTEAGVLFLPGRRTREIKPGLLLWWPLISELKITPTTQRTIEICAQIVGEETISIAVFWFVLNPWLALTRLTDITGNLDDYAQSALSHVCCTGGALSNEDLRTQVQKTLADRVCEFGLEISDIGIVHRGRPWQVKLIKDWATHEEVNRGE